MYGEPLMIPGDFTSSNSTPWDATNLVQPNNLSISTSAHKTPSGYVPTALRSAKYVFVRLDAHRKPHQNPYNGPYEVIEAGDKVFRVRLGDREELITIDRLKPAYMPCVEEAVATPPHRARLRTNHGPPSSPASPYTCKSETLPTEHYSRYSRALRQPDRL